MSESTDRGPVVTYFQAPDGSLFTLGPRRISIGPAQADDDDYLRSWSMDDEDEQ